MAEINNGKVVVGGLVAGLVINVSEYVLNEIVVADAQAQAFDAMGIAGPGGREIAVFVALGFVMGITMIWLYAALRASQGAGPKTAVCVGIVAWVLASVMCVVPAILTGSVATSPGVIGLIWTLVELPVAALAGAFLYSD